MSEPDGLLDAFWSYEAALMGNDLGALDRLFAPGDATLRTDAAGMLVGHDQISAFRGGRGGAPQRTVVELQVQVIDDDTAFIMAVTELAKGGRGQQSQLWRRDPAGLGGADATGTPGGWQVVAAHVAVTGPAIDTRIWRVVGDPLVSGAPQGPLVGETVAVKDLFSIAGQKVGAGSPAYLAAAPPATRTARAVQRLTDAGAAITGISRTDEFAWSLFGDNAHYGTPPNPHAPRRLSGGSSSGSATATTLGQVSIGLGTDTGGSIRVPSSWQGLWGIRTTHDAVTRDGLLALAPSFDTVGWMARDPHLLERVGDVLLPRGANERPHAAPGELVLAGDLLGLAAPDVRAAVEGFARELGTVFDEHFGARDLAAWRETFALIQAAEAYAQHRSWISSRLGTLTAPVRGRFEAAADLEPAAIEQGYADLARIRAEIVDRIGDRVWLLPSTPTVAPLPGTADQTLRETLLELTCIAGIGGLPAVSIPLRTADNLPCGICLVAAPGRDRELLTLARQLAG